VQFYGNIEGKVDGKGRVFLPAPFRKELTVSGVTDLMVRPSVDGRYLELYPNSVWNAYLDSITSKMDEFAEDDRELLRTIVWNVEKVTPDGSGRILISRRFLEEAGIGDTVRFLGMKDRIEIWPIEGAQAPKMDVKEFNERLKALRSRNANPNT